MVKPEGLTGRGKALGMMRAHKHRCTPFNGLLNQFHGDGLTALVQRRRRFVQHEQAFTIGDQARQECAQNTDLSALPFRQREHPVIKTVTQAHPIGECGHVIV